MKTKFHLSLFLVLSISFNSFSQIVFEENVLTDNTYNTTRPLDVIAVDIDGDGDMDVLSASWRDDKIAWFENIDGTGTFGTLQIITTNADGASSVYASDIDGDGDMDVLSASGGDDKIAWYKNTDGVGAFSAQQIITTNADGAKSVYACDIDGDGDMDVLSASWSDDKIAWYENIDGVGNFGTQQIITTNTDSAIFVYACDIDGDGDIDVLSASWEDDKIAWYENTDGTGTFGTQQIITTNADYANSVHASDIDGDGDMDVLSASWGGDMIAWYKNTDGMGNFEIQQIISTNGDAAESVYASDIDGDGDIDVLSASVSGSNDKIAWYENIDGIGTFGPQQVITTNLNYAESVYASDIDGDGDMDVLSASTNDNKIAWYENINGVGTFTTQQRISSIVDTDGATSVYASDLDSDGDMDILSASASDGKIAWYKNTDGVGNFDTQQIITTNAESVQSIYTCDIDGDGDMDVLSASQWDDKISWYKNTDGAGTFGSQQVITTNADYANSVYASDLDSDGDMDVLSASSFDNKIAWYKNTDGAGTFGSQKIITTNAEFATSVYASDIDGDGDMDVLSASDYPYHIAWYKNTDGAGTFSTEQIITTNAGSAKSVYASDLDGDGDMDVLSASSSKIAWYRNIDGTGVFGPQQVISTNVDYASSVYASDIDGDGDMDVLSASKGDNKIALYINTDGVGSFGSQQIITTNAQSARSVYAKDIDGDGDMDVLSASYWDCKISWYNNLGPLGVNEKPLESIYIYPNPVADVLIVSSEISIVEIFIYNNLGQLVLSNSSKNYIDLSTLNQGLYFVKMKDINSGFVVKKVIKK